MRNNKGFASFFVMLSIVGVLVGLALVYFGWKGAELSAPIVLGLGIFVTAKEVIDIFH